MTTNMYRVGDYVYFETTPSMPFQIRRIEELNKTTSGNVEAKVMCYFRRKDIPSSLLTLADRHQGESESNGTEHTQPVKTSPASNHEGDTDSATKMETDAVAPKEEEKAQEGDTKAEPAEVKEEPVEEESSSKQKYLLNQRELFLSKQVEVLPATNIRGKCSVTLFNETESFSSYVEKEDAFFYTLVYDPVQRTLLADRGEIRVGSRFQAEPTPLLKEGASDGRNLEELEVLTWTPEHGLSDREIDQFLVVARSVGTFARALDCSSSVKQPSLHMSAAAATRDVTLFHAMDVLHQCNYDVGKAMCALVPSTGPILCRDQMEEWSASEANLFEEAMEKYGKDFGDIRQDFLPWKVPSNLIEYYYLWKTTDRYVQQKRVKAVEAESKLKQVYIPPYNKPHPAAIGPPLPQSSKNGAHQIEIGLGPGKVCECCSVATSVQWYAWGSTSATSLAAQSQSRLCQSCWSYWKKYGDLPIPSKSGSALKASSDDDSKNSAVGSEALGSRLHRCGTQGCGKTRTAFYLAVTPTTRLARRFCVHLLRPRRAARFPFLPISAAAIRQDFQTRMARKTPAEVQSLLTRAQKPLTPLRPPKRIRVSDLTFRLARGQISTTTAAWLVLPDRSLPKPKPAREAFPKPPKAADGSLIYERIVLPQRDTERVKRRHDDSPSDAPPFKRSTRESPANVTSPLSVLAPLSGLAMGLTGSPTPTSGTAAFVSNLPLPISSLRSNLPPDLYVSALASSTNLAPLLPGSKISPGSSAISPTGKSGLLPSGAQSLAPSNPLVGRASRNHGPRAVGALHGHSGGRVKQLPTWMDAPDDLFFHSTQVTKKLRRQLATQELRRAARKPWRTLNTKKA